jgi:hypothetical protein
LNVSPGLPRAGRKIGITLHVPAAALCSDEMPVLRHVNEDHIVPELQLVERFHRLMMAAETKAMHSEGRLAAGASMGDGLCGLATRHLETIFSGLNMKRPSAPRIRDAGAALPVESAVLDGEAIVMRSADRCDFEALRSRQGQAEAILVAYDIVWRSGRQDVRPEPLETRRKRLARLLRAKAVREGVQLSEALAGDGAVCSATRARGGFEGIVSKRIGSRNVSGRTRALGSRLRTRISSGDNYLRQTCLRFRLCFSV